jgi:hypothetical protein
LYLRASRGTREIPYKFWDASALELKTNRDLILQGAGAVAPPNSWLWYSFDYELELDFRDITTGRDPSRSFSHILGGTRRLKTTFYSFQRLFYLAIQSRLDTALLDRLLQLRQGVVPQVGTVHVADHKTAFISRPVEHTADAFNTNALLTALLASSDEPPVTADNTAGQTLVDSTAPQNMAHASLWEDVLRHPVVQVNGVELRNPAFATVDTDGHLAEISAASIASVQPGIHLSRVPASTAIRHLATIPQDPATSPLPTAHGLPGGAFFDSHLLQAAPIRAAPPGYVLTGDIQLYGILPGKLYSFQGTASNGAVHEIVTLADVLPLARLFPSFADGDFGSIRFENVQLRYDDRVTDDKKPPGTWLEGDMVFQGDLQPIADVLKSVFNQTDPKLHVEFFMGMIRDWNTLAPPEDFTISGSLEGINVKWANVIQFTSVGVRVSVNRTIDPSPYRENIDLAFSFFGTSLVNVPGSIVPLGMDFTMTMDDGIVSLNLTLQDPDWKNAFGIEGLAVSDSISVIANYC